MTTPQHVLFGNAALMARRSLYHVADTSMEADDDASYSVEGRSPNGHKKEDGILQYLFGFMWDELDEEMEDVEILRSHTADGELVPPLWNPLNTCLFVAYALTTAATSVPVTLIPAMSDSLSFGESANETAASFAPRVTSSAVLGTACGKLLLSCFGDLFGARRTSVTCAILLSCALLFLSLCQTAHAASWACFLVEFCQSVQWPCIIVALATHYRHHGNAVYEGGIFVTSLASRFGVLCGIPLSSLLLRRTSWRWVAVMGAWASLVASSIIYLFVTDSPHQPNDPQNPIDPLLLQKYQRKQPTLANFVGLVMSVFRNNIAPSLRHVLRSPAFYIVALAHTGSSAIRTSERILGSYYLDTSMNTLSENRAGGLAVVLSFGTIFGLLVAGHLYTKGTERQRKQLVMKLYMSTIASCYILAILAIPRLQTTINTPSLILIFQLMATFVMGASIAVPLYQIPSLVGATFGCDKGLYSGYTDGVAYGLSSLVWRIVGNSVQHDGSAGGPGWAYGWAAVALLLIVSGVLMVEFMEHYFVRPGARTAGGYETIIFA